MILSSCGVPILQDFIVSRELHEPFGEKPAFYSEYVDCHVEDNFFLDFESFELCDKRSGVIRPSSSPNTYEGVS